MRGCSQEECWVSPSCHLELGVSYGLCAQYRRAQTPSHQHGNLLLTAGYQFNTYSPPPKSITWPWRPFPQDNKRVFLHIFSFLHSRDRSRDHVKSQKTHDGKDNYSLESHWRGPKYPCDRKKTTRNQIMWSMSSLELIPSATVNGELVNNLISVPRWESSSKVKYPEQRRFRRPRLTSSLRSERASPGGETRFHHQGLDSTAAGADPGPLKRVSLSPMDPAQWINIGCSGLSELCAGSQSCALQLKHTD